MYQQKSRNGGSAVRRSLMAFVIAATPLAAVASVSGVAQAGTIDEVTAEIVCGKDGAYVDVEIDNELAGGEFYSIWVEYTLVLDGKSPGHINSKKIAEGLAEGPVYVEVRLTDGDVLVEDFNLTVDCDGVETISCANRSNPVITVTTPDSGSFYDVYLYEGAVEIDFDNLPGTELDSVLGAEDETSLELLPGGDGIFTVAFDGNGGNDTTITVEVDCPRKKRSTTPTTTPLLPSTGSESNTLLAVAPLMVLLGGALIVARRRLANA